jgi:hypothetical protein
MEPQEVYLLKCALADLEGAKQAKDLSDPWSHDWKAHQQTMDEIREYLFRNGYLTNLEY